ncbi:hypothetical protein KC354_g10084 [Hortaea werneckii]|nr:hypothetical protein KC354_g10084 [Hortaea werneckii]
MAPSRAWEKNVKPQRIADDDAGESDDMSAAGDGVDEADREDGDEYTSGSEVYEDARSEQDDEEQSPSEEGNVQDQMSNVSFGALKQAQDTLSRKRKRKRGSDANEEQEDKLKALRKRLKELKGRNGDMQQGSGAVQEKSGSKATKAKVTQDEATPNDEDDDASDSDSAPSEEGAPNLSRSSKHAPAAQSTRHQVSRKRNVIDVPKRVVRDPRFDALQQRHSHSGNNSEKAYSFLRDYQKSEISELKAALKKAKSEEDKVTLRRKINSMENRLKSKESKERQQEVLRKHRKEEREKVQQGKTPYFLKKKDLKEQALVEKFKGMKSKDRAKLVEKRKKKEGQKERKKMPEMSRRAG